MLRVSPCDEIPALFTKIFSEKRKLEEAGKLEKAEKQIHLEINIHSLTSTFKPASVTVLYICSAAFGLDKSADKTLQSTP